MILLWISLWAIGWMVLYALMVKMSYDYPDSWNNEKRFWAGAAACFSWVGVALVAIVASIIGIIYLISLGSVKYVVPILRKFEIRIMKIGAKLKKGN